MRTIKYAVIVKHIFRDSDYRVDIIEVPESYEDIGPYEVKAYWQSKIIGPFEIVKVTDRISSVHFFKEDFDKLKQPPAKEACDE